MIGFIDFGGFNFNLKEVATYDELPLAKEHKDKFFWVRGKTGKYGDLVMPLRRKGWYRSNGQDWEARDIPADIKTAIDTLSSRVASKANTEHTHDDIPKVVKYYASLPNASDKFNGCTYWVLNDEGEYLTTSYKSAGAYIVDKGAWKLINSNTQDVLHIKQSIDAINSNISNIELVLQHDYKQSYNQAKGA